MKSIVNKLIIVLVIIQLVFILNTSTFAVSKKQPQQTKITKVTVDNGKAIIKWKKVKGVDGYSLYISNSKNGKYTKIKNIYGYKNIKYTKKGIDESKEYYFKVKTFIMVNNKKVYSVSSNKRSGGGIIASKILTSTSNLANRNINLKISSRAIDGIIVKPGKKIVWSNVIGELSEAKGYKKAIAYLGENNTLSVGGGVCQVSTNLYQCAKQSKMKIIERHEHGRPVTYIKMGEDATVSQGQKDFIFKNNKSYAIKIVADAYENTTMCKFYKVGDI